MWNLVNWKVLKKGKLWKFFFYVFAWNNLHHVTKHWDVETNIKTSKLWGKSCLSNNKVGTCQFPRTSVKFTKPLNSPKIAPNFRTTFIPIFSFGFHWNLKNDGKSFPIPAFRSLQPIVGALRRSEKVICIKFSFKLQLPMRAHQRVSRGKKVAPRRRVEVILLIAYIYENFPWNSILFCCCAGIRISIFFTSFFFVLPVSRRQRTICYRSKDNSRRDLTYVDEIFTVYEDIKKVTHLLLISASTGVSIKSTYDFHLSSFLSVAFPTNLIFIRLMLRGAFQSQMLGKCCVKIWYYSFQLWDSLPFSFPLHFLFWGK